MQILVSVAVKILKRDLAVWKMVSKEGHSALSKPGLIVSLNTFDCCSFRKTTAREREASQYSSALEMFKNCEIAPIGDSGFWLLESFLLSSS